MNSRNYTITVKCISKQANVYCIKADEFRQYICKNDKTWQYMMNLINEKDKKMINKIY
jgi:hypothetical protein